MIFFSYSYYITIVFFHKKKMKIQRLIQTAKNKLVLSHSRPQNLQEKTQSQRHLKVEGNFLRIAIKSQSIGKQNKGEQENRKRTKTISLEQKPKLSIKKSLPPHLNESKQLVSLNKNRIQYSTEIRKSELFEASKLPLLSLSPVEKGKELINQMVECLKRKFYVTQNHLSSFIIRKQILSQLIQQLLAFPLKFGRSKITAILNEPIFKYMRLWQKQRIQQESQKLKIFPMPSHSYSQHQYNSQIAKVNSSIEYKNKVRDQLDRQNQQLTGRNQQIEQELKNKQLLLSQYNLQLSKIRNLLQSDSITLNNTNQNLAKQTLLLQQIEQQAGKLANFTTYQQNDKLLQIAAQQYHKIQNIMHQYASEMQFSQLATSYSYQPQAINQIEFQMERQLKQMGMLVQSQQISIKDKHKAIRSFANEMMHNFRVKDQQQGSMLEEKTKCIIQFVEHLKKWIDHKTIKDQCLTDLRKAFINDNLNIKRLIKEHSNSEELLKAYTKIEINYKMGNYFY